MSQPIESEQHGARGMRTGAHGRRDGRHSFVASKCSR